MEENKQTPAPVDASHELDLEPVFTAVGADAELEALAIHSMLEANGVHAVVVGSSALPNLPFEVRVPSEERDLALRLIEEAKAAGPAAAEEAEQQQPSYTPGVLERAIPTLPSLNLDESLACYQQLGFQLTARYGDDYAILSRDEAEIHLFSLDDEHVAKNSGCYFVVRDVEKLHNEIVANGYTQIGAVEEKPWGMREFTLQDSSGNCLRFGQRVRE
ncbi:MAG: VOC family protein [Bryobacteraceae bacterium]|nr:VOC family protein [Bryobacteraceae bacterium]MDW8380227.1 VOC family protein [Bryobacterales bacterium]